MKTQILVADDEAGFRDLFRFVLEPMGFEVLTVSDGEQAVRAMQARAWDLVFLDSQMPHMDGLEALSRIRTLRPQQAVVMMSGRAEAASEHAQKTIDRGARAYLVKPFEIDDLIAQVEAVVHGGGR